MPKARRSTLIEAAIETLASSGRPMTLDQITRAVLRVETNGAKIGARVLAPLLATDDRLVLAEAGHWALAGWEQESHAIDDVDFVVFDVETNGGRGGRHRILEIGAIRVRGGQQMSSYTSLVHLPGRVSKFVTRYTGITNEMLIDTPSVETVLEDFRSFQAGSILIAHNLPTDLGFLNREAIWAGQSLFPGNGLDTMELSVALMPDLPGIGLAAVLEAANIRDTPTHRALDDARVTADLFQFLLGCASKHDVRTVADLRSLETRGGPEGRLPRRARTLARWASRNLPPSAGVYVFRDTRARALYVGKSTSLQRRVRSHFTDSAGFIRRRDGMLERIATIEWESTGSELRALVREAALIKMLTPEYNIQRKRGRGARFIRIGPPDTAVIGSTSETHIDDAAYLGPFQTTNHARLAVNTARRVFGLPSNRSSDKSIARWRRDAAVAFLSKGKQSAIEVIKQNGQADDERKELIRRIQRTRLIRNPIGGGLGSAPALAITAGSRPGDVELARIEAGVIASVVSLTRPRRQKLDEVLSRMGEPCLNSTENTSEEQSIVLAWLHANIQKPDVFIWDTALSREFVNRVWKRVKIASTVA